ncbi:hypothetical protein MR857_12370 [bacterium]|nr:hypothetical protein [bacterium]
MTYLLEKMKDLGPFPEKHKDEIRKLLPWSDELPDSCRTKTKKE